MRDLKKEVGGIMMLESLKALQQDDATGVIVLISRPPADEGVRLILDQVAASAKPTVICFLGGDPSVLAKSPNVVPAHTLYECALLAARLVRPEIGIVEELLESENIRLAERAESLKTGRNPRQRYLRGLFSGGTLCYEAQVIWKKILEEQVYSNAPLPGGATLTRFHEKRRAHGGGPRGRGVHGRPSASNDRQ